MYDEQGQPLSGSLMDYAIPKADNLPWLDVTLDEIRPSSIRWAPRAWARADAPRLASSCLRNLGSGFDF